MNRIHRLKKASYDQERLIKCTNRVYVPRVWDNILFTEEAEKYCVPPLFELTSLKDGKKVYAGFENYTELNFVIVPPWVLQSLGDENDNVSVSLVHKLSPCTGMRLSPISNLFFDEIDQQEFCLLNALHFKYSAITKGQIIDLAFGPKTFKVLVDEVFTESGEETQSVWIIDTEASLSIGERYYVEKYVNLEMNKPTEEMFVDSGDYKYLRLMHVRNTSCLCINVDTNIGDTA
ncbi:MAG: hypothetical protein EZS28_026805, partial [Streblomastix strix]